MRIAVSSHCGLTKTSLNNSSIQAGSPACRRVVIGIRRQAAVPARPMLFGALVDAGRAVGDGLGQGGYTVATRTPKKKGLLLLS